MNISLISKLILILAGLAAILCGQEFRGTILGRMTDPTGAVVPNAAVQLTNEETNAGIAVRSNEEGNFAAPFLLPALVGDWK